MRTGSRTAWRVGLLAYLSTLFAGAGWANPPNTDWSTFTIRGQAQGTTYQVSYYAAKPLIERRSIDSIVAVIDSSMSLYKPHSQINRFNDSTVTALGLDPHFRAVLAKSFEIYHRSEGIFDVTVAPLVQLWGFGPKPQEALPSSLEVRQALSCVGMDKIWLQGDTLVKGEQCVRIDLNGIAQGYTVDVIADFIERKGIRQYVVELGGELRVQGPKPDGSPLRIGIERPAKHGGGGLMQEVLAINTGSVTTAGSYRRFVEDDGKTLSHHIDPKTGYPFQSDIVSATIYAPDAITADGYDNVIMAMKPDQAIAFVDNLPGVEVFIIYIAEDGTTAERMSAGFHQLLADTRN